MTQPVSSGARWPRADVSCSDPSGEDPERLTCNETRDVPCAERAHRAARPQDDATDGDAPWGLSFCRGADSVVEGFLCSEPTVVSDACRTPNNAFDAFVCDEPKMQRLQWAILRETWAIVKSLAGGVFRGKP
jgi:hypothetical protein